MTNCYERGALAPRFALLYSTHMKVCIITGIFEPESGGPATYAPRIAAELVRMGHTVTLVTYAPRTSGTVVREYPFEVIRVPRGNKILNRIRFFFACLFAVRASDCVYMLDWFAAGVPAMAAAVVCRKSYVVRVGGDYLWEQKYLESGESPITLRQFYESGMHARRKYRFYAASIRQVLSRARHVICNAEEMRDLYVQYWNLDPSRVSVIFNPIPQGSVSRETESSRHEFVFWGRFIVMKNIPTLLRAFAQARIPRDYVLTLIGAGPRRREVEMLIEELSVRDRVTLVPALSQEEVLSRVRGARAFVLPSWTDISPNQVHEALSIGLLSIVTKENFLSIKSQLPRMIDPSSVDDITLALEEVADDVTFAKYREAFLAITIDQSWEKAATDHMAIFERIV